MLDAIGRRNKKYLFDVDVLALSHGSKCVNIENKGIIVLLLFSGYFTFVSF